LPHQNKGAVRHHNAIKRLPPRRFAVQAGAMAGGAIAHVANVTTPTMYVLGDQDYRTPPADGGEMMFRALKYRKARRSPLTRPTDGGQATGFAGTKRRAAPA
jgi:hypothetical protein